MLSPQWPQLRRQPGVARPVTNAGEWPYLPHRYTGHGEDLHRQPDGIVPIDTAIALLKDMGGSSVKFFPMGELACRDEYQAVAEACARHGFWLEPTGGIDLENFEEIVRIALDAGVEKVIPHVYSSIIDSTNGQTRPEDVRTLLDMVKQLLSD